VTTAIGAPRLARVPVALAGAAVLLQIGYPLTSGDARDRLTVVTVLVFAAASVSHAAVHRGPGWATAYTAVTAGLGLLAESVGTATGVPFGAYDYADSLGAKLLGVPLVIPVAWVMFAYPCLLVGQRLARSPAAAAAVGAWALASWDLFLDPQMVEAAHWRWADVEVGMPFAADVPLSNTLGWLLVGGVVLGLLLAWVGKAVAAAGARARRRRAEQRLRASIEAVVDPLMIEPVEEELSRHRRAREALERAGTGG